MQKRSIKLIALFLGLGLAAAGASAQLKATDMGKAEYMANCASCHGVDGKGNGPNKPYLTRSPTDLTILAKTNKGILPMARVYDVIEGNPEIVGHGSRDMPTWGFDYRVKGADYYMDFPYNQEAFVRGRILALVEYINRIQVK
jgi:mono/diheme cytochrome c family protein